MTDEVVWFDLQRNKTDFACKISLQDHKILFVEGNRQESL